MKHALRKDDTCLNCGAKIPERFCSTCGQENIEPRQSFTYLIKHFFEDITHYEGKFWQTLFKLLFRPAYLSKTYLEGKRKQYVNPVRLYIFISFITFIIPHFFSVDEKESLTLNTKQQHHIDSLSSNNRNTILQYDSELGLILIPFTNSKEELDKAYGTDSLTLLNYFTEKKAIELNHYNPKQLWQLFTSSLSGNFPKTLFIYMPIFALVLGLFFRKSHPLYFDFAIYTLHLFSFLLLLSSLYYILSWLISMFVSHELMLFVNIQISLFSSLVIWFIYYYFRSNYIFNKPSRFKLLKSLMSLMVNTLVFGITFIGLLLVTLYFLK